MDGAMSNINASKSLLSRRLRPSAKVAKENDSAIQPDPCRSIHNPFSWPRRFFARHDIAYEWENKAWALNKTLNHELLSPRDVMSFIFRTDETSARYEGRIRPILDVCYDIGPQDLLESDHPGPCRKMGWIIDGYYREKKQKPWTLRQPLGALSARELTQVLLKKRYVTFASANTLEDIEAIDAERRLIYLTDLDCWGILALILTSPESQARLLSGFLHRHICARTSIGVSIAPDGPSIFALDFHVPFRVWRTSDHLIFDPRVNASTGKPLRSSRNMNFILAPTNSSYTPVVHGIYSGHVGCLTTGYDQWRWTAILSIDTWFNSGECATDKVERYQFDLEDGMLVDPLTGGQDDAERPIWEPRSYFLRVMLLRIGQVADEWELVRNNLELGIANMTQRKTQLFLRLRPFSTGLGPENYSQEFEVFEAHLRDVKEIIQDVLHDLYETLKTGEGFLSAEVYYFLNNDGSPGDATECQPTLSEIRRNFNELAQLHAIFVGLKEKCDTITQDCAEARRKYFFQHDVYGTRTEHLPLVQSQMKLQAGLRRVQTQAEGIERAPSSVFHWPRRFLDRPLIALEWENLPWISHLELTEKFSADAICLFLDTEEYWIADESRMRSLVDIFHDASLESLRHGAFNVPSNKKALLIDGTYADNVSRFRPNQGGLSARELMEELLKERYSLDPTENADAIDAERRLIYLTDTDAWGMLALVSTAPESLFRLLGDYLLDYTCSNPSINVSFSTEGPSTFSLHFSFPFYVWRSTEKLMVDSRVKKSTGEPLRSSRDVTFLSSLANPQLRQNTVDAVYATNFSCLIAGFDQDRWTGIMLAETWFDQEHEQDDPSPDMIAHYTSDFQTGKLRDPFDRGKTTMDVGKANVHRKKWLPRVAFMRTFVVRYAQAQKEWAALLHQINDRADKIGKHHLELLSQVRALAQHTNNTWNLDGEELEEFQESLLRFRELLNDIAPKLREIVGSAERFMAADSKYFLDPGQDTEKSLPYLSQVRKTSNSFRALVFRMDALQERCKSMISNGQRSRQIHLSWGAISDISSCPPYAFDVSAPILSETKTPGRVHLWSLFSKSPLPYFWIIAVLAENSWPFDAKLWHHVRLTIYIVLPAFLLVYASWRLHSNLSPSHSEVRHGRTDFPRRRVYLQRNDEDFGVGDWIRRKLDLLTGGLSDFTAIYRNNQQPVRPPGSTFRRLWDALFLGNQTESWTPLISNENTKEQILICLADEKNCLWRLKHISRTDCQDAKSFFIAMRSLVKDRPQQRWQGTLSGWGLRQPKGIHYVKFSLRGKGLVRIISREVKFPPRSIPAIYRPTEADPCDLVESDRLLDYYNTPPESDEVGADILDRITHKIDGPFPDNQVRGTGYGIAIEEGPNLVQISNVRLALVASFIIFGILWSWVTGDIEHGFAIASVLGFASTVAMATLERSATSRALIPCP